MEQSRSTFRRHSQKGEVRTSTGPDNTGRPWEPRDPARQEAAGWLPRGLTRQADFHQCEVRVEWGEEGIPNRARSRSKREPGTSREQQVQGLGVGGGAAV